MPPSRALPLPANEVHVWTFALDLPSAEADRVGGWLSPDERARAAAFHFARDRKHFAAARGLLRGLLARYLDRLPDTLRFEVGAAGKPSLAGKFGSSGLTFNVSHSHGYALIAVARNCALGIDLEQMREEVDCAGIVHSHFSSEEIAVWESLPESRQREAFFHGWARKEAYVKALGEGLGHESTAYTVDLDPAAPRGLIADRLSPDAPARWRLESVPSPAGFAAAIAYAVPRRNVVLFTG